MKFFLSLSVLGILAISQITQAKWRNTGNNRNRLHQRSGYGHQYQGGQNNLFENLQRILQNGGFNLGEYLHSSCPKKIPIDYKAVKEAESCLREQIGMQTLNQLFFLAGSSQFQEFGSKACKIWPTTKSCIGYVLEYVESCHDKGNVELFTETIAQYLCSTSTDSPDGSNNLSEFLTYGGLQCNNMGKFARCMRRRAEAGADDTCTTLEKVRNCGALAFEGCASPRPWEIVSGGLDQLEIELRCGADQGYQQQQDQGQNQYQNDQIGYEILK